MEHRRITAKHANAGCHAAPWRALWETSGFNDACNSSAERFTARGFKSCAFPLISTVVGHPSMIEPVARSRDNGKCRVQLLARSQFRTRQCVCLSQRENTAHAAISASLPPSAPPLHWRASSVKTLSLSLSLPCNGELPRLPHGRRVWTDADGDPMTQHGEFKMPRSTVTVGLGSSALIMMK